MNPIKLALARALDVTGLSTGLRQVYGMALGHHLRAVNYHDVPNSDASAFEAQLRFFAKHYCNIGPTELRPFLDAEFTPKKAGILLTFDDGLRSHAEVAAPLLEKYGFTGWFMVPAGFVDTPEADQATFAAEHSIVYADEPSDGRVAMSWDQLRGLDGTHVIGCHSTTHRRLGDELDANELDLEVVASKRRFEEELGHSMDVFCWVGSEESSYGSGAAAAIRAAGYQLSFMTNNYPILPGCNPLQLQRTNIETVYSPSLVRLNLCGIMDLLYRSKRERVNQKTAGV